MAGNVVPLNSAVGGRQAPARISLQRGASSLGTIASCRITQLNLNNPLGIVLYEET